MSEEKSAVDKASCDPGWNDPPLFAYDSRQSTGKSHNLNKRVAYKMDSLEQQKEDSTKCAMKISPAGPPPCTRKFGLTNKSSDEIQPLEKEISVSAVLENFDRTIEEDYNNGNEKEASEIKRRLAIMERMWNEQKFPPAMQQKVFEISEGEAVGAIGDPSALEILNKYVDDPAPEVAETCQLAVKRIQYLLANPGCEKKSKYITVDPTPTAALSDVERLRAVLLNDNEDLFERYKAMFALRDINTSESVLALCEGLFVGGALFRHEVAFVLGQLQKEESVPHLIKALADLSQNEMVRHECAEALGSIATEECFEKLRKYLKDESQVVRDSCEVALDMAEYETSKEFQYANTAQACT